MDGTQADTYVETQKNESVSQTKLFEDFLIGSEKVTNSSEINIVALQGKLKVAKENKSEATSSDDIRIMNTAIAKLTSSLDSEITLIEMQILYAQRKLNALKPSMSAQKVADMMTLLATFTAKINQMAAEKRALEETELIPLRDIFLKDLKDLDDKIYLNIVKAKPLDTEFKASLSAWLDDQDNIAKIDTLKEKINPLVTMIRQILIFVKSRV